jgi:hypothetical protein
MVRPVDVNDPVLDRARALFMREASRLRTYPNVTGVGVGLGEVGGRVTDEVCIRVYVARKLPRASLSPDAILPDRIDGVRVDVIEGTATLGQGPQTPTTPADHRRWHEVMRGGIVIASVAANSAGTLGVTVADNRTGAQMLLTNYHVICHPSGCVPGEHILQQQIDIPGVNTPEPGAVVALVERGVFSDEVDCAVASLTGARFLLPEILGVGAVRGARAAQLGQHVRRAGMRSGVDELQVVDLHYATTVPAQDGFPDHAVQNQITAKSAAKQEHDGDSGSVLIDDEGYVVGLAWSGGNTDLVRASPILSVLAALDVNLDLEQTAFLHQFAMLVEAS